jgi:hypothetical protein
MIIIEENLMIFLIIFGLFANFVLDYLAYKIQQNFMKLFTCMF